MTESRRQVHRRVDLRKTYPLLYQFIMLFSIGSILNGVNLWFYAPTFHPYNIPDAVIAFGFLIIGVTQIVFLNVWRNLTVIRITLGVGAAFNLGWAITNTQQIFDGNASWQLPLAFAQLAIGRVLLAKEPPVNPVTERR